MGLKGSYHGDTLGAMNAQAPSVFTGFKQVVLTSTLLFFLLTLHYFHFLFYFLLLLVCFFLCS